MSASAIPKLPKRKIKEAIKARLLGQTDAQSRIYVSRVVPTESEETPAILIYSTGESSGIFDMSQKRYRRVLEVRIECIVQGASDEDLDLRMEKLADQVEALMERDETFGNVASELELLGSDYQWDNVADAPLGVLALRYGITFFTYAQRLEGECLDQFKKANVGWNIGESNSPPDSDIDAEDDITIP